jgi:hypothetical protein
MTGASPSSATATAITAPNAGRTTCAANVPWSGSAGASGAAGPRASRSIRTVARADLVATLDRLGIEPLGADAPARLYTRHRTAAVASSSTPAPRRHPAKEAAVGISLGDRAALRFLDDDKVVTVTLDGARHDPVNGLAGADTPLGRALLGLGDEDEGAYAEDGRERRFLVMRVETSRAAAASGQAR